MTFEAAAAQLHPQDFAYGAEIRAPQRAAAYRVALPADVYRRALRPDLGDVRIFNARGEPVPQILQPAASDGSAIQPAQSLPLFPLRGEPHAALEQIRAAIESGNAVQAIRRPAVANPRAGSVQSYIVDARSFDAPIGALQLDWPAVAPEFAGRIAVEVSDSLDGWRKLADEAPIANLHADGDLLTERRVELPATKAKFWRLTWAGAVPAFELTGVRAEPAEKGADIEREPLSLQGSAVEGRPDEFTFDLGAPLPVDRVNFELPERNSIVRIELFSRATASEDWRPVLKSGYYRLETRNGEMHNGPVPIQTHSDRYWLARVDPHGGGLGGDSLRLNIGWTPHEILFLARGEGPFQLAYGSVVAQPVEANLDSVLKSEPAVRATVGAVHELGGVARLSSAPPQPLWNAPVLWAALIVGVLLLGWFAYRQFKRR